MWANAPRDGRPAEYRWRPLFNAAKFGWRPLLECRAVTLPRCKTRWNLQECPKLVNRYQPLVGRSSPYCKDMWRRYCCLRSFSPIDNKCFTCEDLARQSCPMVHRCRIFGDFSGPAFPASRVQQISDLHSKATPCVEVWQTSNLRRLRLDEEKRKKNKRQGKNIMVCPIP